jgi:hypothetical protein
VNAGVGYGLTPGSHRLDVQDDHRNGSERGRVRQIERGKQDASQTEISSDQLFPPLVPIRLSSGNGTKRTNRDCCCLSAFGGKADIAP